MSDFEVAPTDYMQEITLSRALATAIANQIENGDSNLLSLEVRQAYNRLYGEYIRQQQAGVM
jgi:hypothetical protein